MLYLKLYIFIIGWITLLNSDNKREKYLKRRYFRYCMAFIIRDKQVLDAIDQMQSKMIIEHKRNVTKREALYTIVLDHVDTTTKSI